MNKNIPHERYAQDVMGMPVFAAVDSLTVMLLPEIWSGAIPQDDENCAIALGCKRQLHTPYVSVGRTRTDLALPHPEGVTKPGHGETKWAVVRFGNSHVARSIIIAADTGTLGDEGVVVTLNPPRNSFLPGIRRERNKQFREAKGVTDGRGKTTRGGDELTLMGVRSLTGQRKR